jgi:hypothetical protein
MMNSSRLPMRGASAAYAVLLGLALIAFWPGYLSVPKTQLSAWVHLHAVTATLWMFLLIGQPLAIHSGHRQFHRWLGRSSLLLMPVLVISFIGLSHAAAQGATGPELGMQAWFLYIRLILVTMFVGSFAMAMIYRQEVAVHARYMVCTGLSLIDPVFSRLAWRAFDGNPDINYETLTFGLVCSILLVLIWLERNARAGRRVFPTMLSVYFLLSLPLVLDFSQWGAIWEFWKSVTTAFAALPIP